MTPEADVDVVVIGFGMAGAAAALSAASAGARVLALDARPLDARPLDRRRDRLRAAALAEGVEVRAPYRVHELVTEAGRVCGVGYATLPPGTLASAGHQWLRRMSGRPGAGWRGAGLLGRAAESVWASRFVVGEVRCPAVVLAIGARHWDFVGAATWSATRMAGGEPGARAPGWLTALPAAAAPPTPELTARRWLASRAGAWRPPRMGELLVEAATGAVLVDEEHAVAGLYSAIQVNHGAIQVNHGAIQVNHGAGRVLLDEPDALGLAGRAGYGAVSMARSCAHQGLSSVG